MANDGSFADRVRAALGDEVNPAYLEAVLEKPDLGILRWLQDQLADSVPTVDETTMHETLAREFPASPAHGKNYKFGLRILTGRVKLWQFVLAELTARSNAITAEGDAPRVLR